MIHNKSYRSGQVMVIRHEREGEEPDAEVPLGSPENPEHDLVELMAGTEEKTTVDRTAGRVDEGTALRDETESSWHGQERRKPEEKSLTFLLMVGRPANTGGRADENRERRGFAAHHQSRWPTLP